ncbi:MAG: helix-turn-helix transcriptional regulator [Oscillospiraceae bacterium]|nr:helix-turn-helix transcriptional regulator [Oscillospiraceae bacterium]
MIDIKLRSLLERRGMTQSELAKRTGIRPSTISDICNNNADFIKLDFLNRILNVLKCGLNDVLEFKGGDEL